MFIFCRKIRWQHFKLARTFFDDINIIVGRDGEEADKKKYYIYIYIYIYILKNKI